MHRAPTVLFVTTLFVIQLQTQVLSAQNDPDPTRWINYTQAYFKIPIAQTGMYHLTAADIKRAGIPVDRLDPTTIQLFHRGIEQAIYIEGETDHRFDPTDFLEFYGRGNDGAQDSLLYHPHSARPHPYYSLFNDTTAYFLTWTANHSPGKRMRTDSDTMSTNGQPEAYHWADECRVYTDTYPGWAAGLPYTTESSYYEAGEGYTGVIQSRKKPYTITFQLNNVTRIGPEPQLDLLLVGRSYGYHQVNYSVGSTNDNQRLVDSIRFVGYSNVPVSFQLSWSDVADDGGVALSTCSQLASVDDYSVSYVRIRYPQLLIGTRQPMQLFQLQPDPSGHSLLLIQNIASSTQFWDISDPSAPKRISSTFLSANQVRLAVTDAETPRTILAVNQVKPVPAIQPVRFKDWRSRSPSYLIISHESLQIPVWYATEKKYVNAVEAYAHYRASPEGGSYDTLTVTMQELFDQYSYGERHPLAIRRFAQQMLRQTSSAPPYLFLIGRGRSTPGIRRDSQQSTLDLVMTAGFPGSDVVFTAGLLANEPDVPAFPTGRINAETPKEVLDYLAKVTEYEHEDGSRLWRKNWLHLSGGQTTDEQNLFRRMVDSYREQALKADFGLQVTTLSKTSSEPTETINLAKRVNEGVGLITFFGHSGLATTDLAFGFCSNDTLGYHNQGRYPFLLLNGCALGNFFYGRPTVATDWVLTPNRGAIAAIAQSHIGYVDLLNTYTSTFYHLLADRTQIRLPLGQLQQETIRRVLAQNPGGRTLANAQQMVLQGDPAIRLFPSLTNGKSIEYESTLSSLIVHPNPFSDHTLFTYITQKELSEELATLTITDLNGHEVRHLTLPVRIGSNEWAWDGCTDTGRLLPTGVYLYSLTVPRTNEWRGSGRLRQRVSGRVILIR